MKCARLNETARKLNQSQKSIVATYPNLFVLKMIWELLTYE